MNVLRESNADVIAVQEVDDWFLNALEEQPWFKEAYEGTRSKGRLEAPGGQCILSRIPILQWEAFDLPGVQGRTVVIARLSVNGNRTSVATFHLESRLEDGPTRAKQLDAVFDRLGLGEAIVMGDFNFSDRAKPESDHIPGEFVDFWPAVHRDQPGFTWDVALNPAAKEGSFPGETSGRIDRILLRSQYWKGSKVKLIGDKAIGDVGNRYPSDHFGVTGTLTRKETRP